MLSPYRILDLTDEKGLLCGKLLGDLGADVIKIEKPGGDLARKTGPFYKDDPNPEKSLFWFAFNTNKRSVTLALEKPGGQDILKQLVKSADAIIESFPPGYMGNLGLGYPNLERINPGIIVTSITPFGQTGPYKDYKTCDLIAWAMGGYMYPFGDPDRPPIRIGHHSQAYLHAAAEAAAATAMALYYRELTGQGQHVDVSVQECVARLDMTQKWDMTRVSLRRGEWLNPRNLHATYIWPCKDGHVMWNYWAGPVHKLWGQPLIDWMNEEGMADEFMNSVSFETLDASTDEGVSEIEKVFARVEETTRKFFMSHTKAELAEGRKRRRLMLSPVSDIRDALESDQLSSRQFWVTLEHPELATRITYPGSFAHVSESEATPRVYRRAPLIGEHNNEIYGRELGLSEEEMEKLRQARVI
jgi:crotonobetainyl-CoA:carnitine CoA-transferase CaiB-like acyl-CoA transferase